MIAGLNITVAQVNPVVGDLDYNLELVLKSWREAPQDQDLIVFPELVLSGYPPEDLILKPAYIDALQDRLDSLVKASEDLPGAAIVGTALRDGDAIYNAAVLIAEGKIRGQIYKSQLPNYGVFDEKRIFAPGPLPNVIDYKGRKLGIMICEDMWFPEPAAHLRDQGAELLIVPNASPYEMDKADQRLMHARNRVQETGLPILCVNQIGGQDELVFDGGSFALDADGEILYAAPSFEEHIEPLSSSLRAQRSNPEPEYLDSGLPRRSAPRNDEESIYKALVLGLGDYVRKNGFPGVLLGLSGGVDSALAAVIAVDALGAENVHCVMLSSPFTSQDSLDDAAELARALGCRYDILSIEEPMQAFQTTIPDLQGVAHENMQSRSRGLILMALSNQSGKMLVTTGNKSEMAVGYATLYGDMCGGYNPLKDLYKSHLYEIARSKDIIPRRIIERAPTAELREDQTDQDSLPDYAVLDAILECLIEKEMGLDETVQALGYERELVLKVWTMLDRNEYKRYQAAPGVKITSKAFGRDRRYPMTNGFVKSLKS